MATITKPKTEKLVDGRGLRKALWPTTSVAPSETTIARLRKSGKIPSVKIGRLIYFDPEQVREALLK